MRKIKISKLIFDYLKKTIKPIVAIAIIYSIFAIIFFLENQSIDAVCYATLLSVVILFCFATVDFFFFRKKVLNLFERKSKLTINLATDATPANLIEEIYEEMISILDKDKKSIISKNDLKYSEMSDYYTLWAHQIKTPISAMKLILQGEDVPENKELLSELQKIEQYVEMVLQYLRMSSNSSDYVFREYNLKK